MNYETLLIDNTDGILTVTINRPHRANALSRQVEIDVEHLFDMIERDESCRVVIMTGAGRHFSGGADLKEGPGSLVDTTGAATPCWLDVFPKSRVPVIAAINGAATGGGCELALACDLRLMADTAIIGLPEIQFGSLPAGGGTQRLPRLIGTGNANMMLMSGLPIDATEALRIGLVNKVVRQDDILPASFAVAQSLSSRAPFALEAAKRLVAQGLELPFSEATQLERRTIATMATPEQRALWRRQAAAASETYSKIFGQPN